MPGWRGRHAPSCDRSFVSPARCAATATASSPRSPSGSPTPASRACTPRSACSRTAASASTPPPPSSPSSTSAAPGSPSTRRFDEPLKREKRPKSPTATASPPRWRQTAPIAATRTVIPTTVNEARHSRSTTCTDTARGLSWRTKRTRASSEGGAPAGAAECSQRARIHAEAVAGRAAAPTCANPFVERSANLAGTSGGTKADEANSGPPRRSRRQR
jgi:hypothetical protein